MAEKSISSLYHHKDVLATVGRKRNRGEREKK